SDATSVESPASAPSPIEPVEPPYGSQGIPPRMPEPIAAPDADIIPIVGYSAPSPAVPHEQASVTPQSSETPETPASPAEPEQEEGDEDVSVERDDATPQQHEVKPPVTSGWDRPLIP